MVLRWAIKAHIRLLSSVSFLILIIIILFAIDFPGQMIQL